MIGTINPMVYGNRRWKMAFVIYAASQIGGSITTGVAVGVASIFLDFFLDDTRLRIAIVAGCATLGAICDMQLMTNRLPGSWWQVPKAWQRHGPSIAPALFGFCIGLGWLTQNRVSSFYILLITCSVSHSILVSSAAMMIYGIVRVVATAAASPVWLDTPDAQVRSIRLCAGSVLVGYLNGIALAGLAGIIFGCAR